MRKTAEENTTKQTEREIDAKSAIDVFIITSFAQSTPRYPLYGKTAETHAVEYDVENLP